MGSSRQECWSGLPGPPPGHLPDPGIKPTPFTSLVSPALAGELFTTSLTWEAHGTIVIRFKMCVYQKLCSPCASRRTFRSFLCIADAAPQPLEAEGIKRQNNQTLDLSLPKPCVLRQAPSVCPLLPSLKVVSVTWTLKR